LGLYRYRALANGLRTDHPIPGLPFADDSHIPVGDARAIEATGRRHGGKTWGRTDQAYPLHQGSGWVAYTTDPGRNDLAWLVRWHPEHGRSVILYRDNGDVLGAYEAFQDGPLLFRAGGYWWDGAGWYRPSQVFDWASEHYFRRPVPSAATVTAADILAASVGDPARSAVIDVAGLDPDAPHSGRWEDDLSLWAARRDGRDLGRCVTGLTAPELATEALIGTPELAEVTGIAPSTLRAYVSRGEADVPLPQAVIAGRSLWSRPVAQEWAEQRQRSPDGVDAAVSAPGGPGGQVPAGQAEAAAALTRSFLAGLWDYRPVRSRWALRWRTRDHVQEVAAGLAADAARYMVRDLIPADALAVTVRHAFLDELADGKRSSEHLASRDPGTTAAETFYGITPKVAEMLGWLALHQPHMAGHAISGITGDAEDRLTIPRHVTEASIRTALELDGGMGDHLDEFLARVLTPAADLPARADRQS
jgi:hypothetical protein